MSINWHRGEASEIEAMSPLGELPDAWAVHPWAHSMPQYEIGHLERVERIEHAVAVTPGVFLTGSAYRGVGLADVVRHATETAERVRGSVGDATASAPMATTRRGVE